MTVRLEDIAKEAGVAPSTVSMALRDHPAIARKTKDRIQALAKDMGYRPDPGLRALAYRRWSKGQRQALSNMAFVAHHSNTESQERYHSYYEYTRSYADELGYNIEFVDLNDFNSHDEASEVLYHRGVSGIILGPVLTNDPPLALRWDTFSVVACRPGRFAAPTHLVNSDVFSGMQIALEQARERGYRRIGAAVFRHDPIANDDHMRQAAALEWQAHLADDMPRLPVHTGAVHDCDAYLAWVEANQPDAIVGMHPSAYWWLHATSYRIPDDIGVAVCASIGPAATGTIAGLKTNDKSIAQAAVDLLESMLRRGERGIPKGRRVILIEPDWQDGDTLPILR